MSATQGCNDDKAVVESFKEALIGRVGADRYQMWFAQGVEISVAGPEETATLPDAARSRGGKEQVGARGDV